MDLIGIKFWALENLTQNNKTRVIPLLRFWDVIGSGFRHSRPTEARCTDGYRILRANPSHDQPY